MMATNWSDPSTTGFFNSPQDFLFKGEDNTFYGQGPAGQQDASKMPTMQQYYFGAPQQQQAPQQMSPIQFGGPQRPEGYNEGPPTRMGGGGSINLGNNVSVPPGALWQRYQALQANPNMAEADPAFQYLKQQGEQALGRSAGARRQRFSGGTMLDFMKQGQGMAAANLRSIMPELRAGAGQEYDYAANEAQARSQRAGVEAMSADPYGQARNAASRYRTLGEYQSSADYAAQARAGQGDQAVSRWMLGQRLNQSTGPTAAPPRFISMNGR